MWLFLILVLVPIIEIALFIQVGGALGFWPTMLIVVLTAFAGTILLRSQGTAALQKLQSDMRGGGNPLTTLAHGALILVSGVVLLTPGFFTDAVGILLLIPPVRSSVIAWAGKNFKTTEFVMSQSGFQEQRQDPNAPLEGEFSVVEDDDPEPDPNRQKSGWTTKE